MNTTEEMLWNYIDGTCTPDEKKSIERLISENAATRLKYEELLCLNKELTAIDLDEPSMAFTYNVMEAIRTENATVPLKAAINKRIIWGITIFFIFTLTAAFVVLFSSVKWSAQSLPANLTANLKIPEINSGKEKMLVQAFVFFDVVLGLYLFDAWLRRKNRANSPKIG